MHIYCARDFKQKDSKQVKLSSERGSITELALVAFPALTTFMIFVVLAMAYTTQITTELDVVEANIGSIAQSNSAKSWQINNRVPNGAGPRAARWASLFINHSSTANRNDAVSTAQSLYGLDSTKFDHLTFLDFVAGKSRGRAVGITSGVESGVRQTGAQFLTSANNAQMGNVSEFYGIRSQVVLPGMLGEKIQISSNFARGLL
jgi:hypothetical protein